MGTLIEPPVVSDSCKESHSYKLNVLSFRRCIGSCNRVQGYGKWFWAGLAPVDQQLSLGTCFAPSSFWVLLYLCKAMISWLYKTWWKRGSQKIQVHDLRKRDSLWEPVGTPFSGLWLVIICPVATVVGGNSWLIDSPTRTTWSRTGTILIWKGLVV